MGIKTFSATLQRDRDSLGDRATQWIRDSRIRVREIRALQSSDNEYHCLSLVVFYDDKGGQQGSRSRRDGKDSPW